LSAFKDGLKIAITLDNFRIVDLINRGERVFVSRQGSEQHGYGDVIHCPVLSKAASFHVFSREKLRHANFNP